MRRLYALYGILSPFPQRPFCVVGRGWGEGKMEVRGRGRGDGASSHRPLRACVFFFYFLIIIFDQLCTLSRVVNSIG